MACVLCLGFWQLGQGAYIPAKAWFAQELLQRAWTRARSGENRTNSWPWSHTRPVARLTANAGEVDLIVLAGSSKHTLALGPGHLAASAPPGEEGNAVIAGHRDTHFQFLKGAGPGDLISVETDKGVRHLYKVVGVDVVDSRKGSLRLDTEGAFLSLVTSYPFEASPVRGPMRYVVTARKLY